MNTQMTPPRLTKPDPPTQEPAAISKVADGTAALDEGASPAPSASIVASLLTRPMLRDGEVVLLVLQPSRWFVPLGSLLFAVGVVIILCALQLSRASHAPMRYYIDAALFVVSCRVMWGILNWMRRVYVLTDQRILRISGVFTMEIYDCPLRKVARTRIARPIGERLLRLGSIEIYPSDEAHPCSAWQTISRPFEVQDLIESAIRKAKQNGCAH